MNRLVKILSICLCITIVMLSMVTTAFALTIGGVDLTDKLSSLKSTPDEAKIFKDESVYVLASADGSVEKIIVSDWIQNNQNSATIEDLAAIKDVQNVKGDETYTMNEDGMRVWNMNGEDLYLKGEGESPLPVDLSVSYTLDGAPISPDELKGKSGHVTIRFDYKNNQYEYVEIDGKKEKIYVPFLMMTGLLLDNGKFSDIEVENGKVLSDGDRTIVGGIAFPGLQSNLDIDKNDIDIPSYVKIEADAEDFELSSTVTIAVGDLFGKIDTDSLDDLDGIEDSLSELESAMSQLLDGSSQLYDGLATLLEKSGELEDGINQLYEGSVSLSQGAEQLSDGAIQIDLGALSLSSGLSALTSNNSALTSGSQATFSSILASAQSGLEEKGLTVPKLTAQNYNQVLESLIENLSEENVRALAQSQAREKVTAAVEAQRDTVQAGVAAAVRQNVSVQVEAAFRQNVTASVLSALGYTAEDYAAAVTAGLVPDEVQAQVNAAIEENLQSDEVQAMISATVDEKMASAEVSALITQNTDAKIAQLIEENLNSDEVQAQIEAAVQEAAAGRATVKALENQLDQYKKFDSGLSAYTGGVSSASAGAGQLKSATATLSSGAKELSAGADELKDGILTLKNGVPTLIDGVTQLKDGAMSLSEGLEQFDSEGISKIVDLFSDDLSTAVLRLKATADVSRNYKSYSGLTDDMDGSVKFIYKTDSIK